MVIGKINNINFRIRKSFKHGRVGTKYISRIAKWAGIRNRTFQIHKGNIGPTHFTGNFSERIYFIVQFKTFDHHASSQHHIPGNEKRGCIDFPFMILGLGYIYCPFKQVQIYNNRWNINAVISKRSAKVSIRQYHGKRYLQCFSLRIYVITSFISGGRPLISPIRRFHWLILLHSILQLYQ